MLFFIFYYIEDNSFIETLTSNGKKMLLWIFNLPWTIKILMWIKLKQIQYILEENEKLVSYWFDNQTGGI